MSDSEMAEHIAKVRQEVSEWPEWKKKLLADSLNPYRESEKSMSDDKMRAEFEDWAKRNGFSVRFSHGSYYWGETVKRWKTWQAAYQAGRNAVQREAEQWSKTVNKRWIETASEREGQL